MVDVYRRLSVQGRSEGLDKVATDLRDVATAQKEVGAASQATATVTEVSSRKTLSAAAAYDRLQRSLDPVYQAQQRLAAAERVLDRARDQGLIDLSRQNELLGFAAQRYQQLAPAIDTVAARMSEGAMASNRLITGMSAGAVALGTSVRNVANQSKQLSFQLFDIAQGLPLAFQSPLYGLQNLAIQTGQVSQLYMGQGGLKQAFADTTVVAKSLGASLIASLFTPLGQVGAITGLLAAGLVAMFISERSHAKRAEEALKTHIDLIGRIKDAYKEAADASTRYGAESIQVLQRLDAEQRRIAKEQLNQQAAQLQIPGSGGLGVLSGLAVGEDARKAVMDLNEEGRKGQGDWRKFGEALDRALNNPALNRGQREIIRGLLEMAAAQARIQSTTQPAAQALPGPVGAEFPNQNDSLIEILKQRAQVERIKRGMEADLTAISARSPAEIGANAALRERISLTNEAMSSTQKEAQIAAAGAIARAQAEHAISEAEIARRVAREQAIESAQVELDVVGKSIAEQASLTEQTQMLQQAKEAARQAGTIVSDEEVVRIKAAADELGRLNQEIALKQLRSDLGFDRATMFSSDTEQRVASSMRDVFGDDWQAHIHDAEAGMIRMNEYLAEGRDLSRDFAGTFIEGLQSGKSVIDSLGDALDQLQKKLLDMVLDQAINGLFSSLAGALGGGFGGARAPVGAGLFHSGGVVGSGGATRYVHPAYFDNAPRMHRGGIAGDEVPAILQRGERVLRRGAGGGERPRVNVQINNSYASGASVDVQETDGGLVVNVAQREAAARRTRKGMQPTQRKSR